jgi:hypothetical protein
MKNELLPGKRHDFFGESEVLREELLALVVDEIVEILPVEDELDEAAILEGSQKSANVDVGNVSSLVWLRGEVLVEDDDSLLKQVSVNCLLFGLLNLDH